MKLLSHLFLFIILIIFDGLYGLRRHSLSSDRIYTKRRSTDGEQSKIDNVDLRSSQKDKLSSNIYATSVVQSSNIFKLVKDLDALTEASNQALDEMETLALKLKERLEKGKERKKE